MMMRANFRKQFRWELFEICKISDLKSLQSSCLAGGEKSSLKEEDGTPNLFIHIKNEAVLVSQVFGL